MVPSADVEEQEVSLTAGSLVEGDTGIGGDHRHGSQDVIGPVL